MLYDGAVRFLYQAAAAMREGAARRPRSACAAPRRSSSTSSPRSTWARGEIASNLQGIYVFSRRQLIEARRERDPEKVDRSPACSRELRESWAQIAGA